MGGGPNQFYPTLRGPRAMGGRGGGGENVFCLKLAPQPMKIDTVTTVGQGISRRIDLKGSQGQGGSGGEETHFALNSHHSQ